MEVNARYVIYKLIETSQPEGVDLISLEKVFFDSWIDNSFLTEEEAVKALIEDNRKYTEYVILKSIYIKD